MSVEMLQGREHIYPAYCRGERCRMCGQPARHKIGEESGPAWFHNLTAYVCCSCFFVIFGEAHDTYPYDMPNPVPEILAGRHQTAGHDVEGEQPPAVDEQLRDPGVDG